MMFAFILLFGWTLWALLFWGAIRIVDSKNSHNYFAHALLWSAVQLGVSLAMPVFGIGGIAMLVLWVVFLLRLLTSQYEMGLLQAILVLAIIIAAPFGLEPIVVWLVKVSELLAIVVFFGLPFFILGGWQWGRRRARRAGEDDRIPRAFAFRRRKNPDVPIAAPVAAPPAAQAAVPPPIPPAARTSTPRITPEVASPRPDASPPPVVPETFARPTTAPVIAPARPSEAPIGEPSLLK